MANTILTIGDITRECLMVMTGALSFTKNVNRQYDDRFAKTGAKIGQTANVRIPPKFTVGSTAAVTAQDLTESTIPVKMDKQRNIAIEVTSADLTLSLDDFSKRFIEPAAKQIAAQIDKEGMQLYKSVYNAVGTAGTAFTALDLFYNAMVKLQDNLAGTDDLKIVVGSRAWTKASQLMMSFFAPRNGDDVVKNYVGNALGFDWYMDANQIVHTVGTHGGSAKTINGAGQTGSTLSVTGFGLSQAGALKAGDIFTIAGVYSVNPLTKDVLPDLQQFVVTTDAASNGSGVCSLTISPSIVVSGASQNVSAGPAAGATVTVIGASATTYQLGLAFHKDAFAFVTAPLQSLAANSSNIYTETDPDTGVTITVEKFRDGRSGSDVFRVDVLFGFSPLRVELATRLITA